MPITVISESQLNADSLRQPWVMAGLGFLRGGKVVWSRSGPYSKYPVHHVSSTG